MSDRMFYGDVTQESSVRKRTAFRKAIGFAVVSFALLFSGGGSFLILQPAVAASATTLNVSALGLDGSAPHMYTTISSNNVVLKTGFTPLSFTGIAGQTYTIAVANYKTWTFAHWDDGSTSKSHTVTLGSSPLSVVAYYNTGTGTSSQAQLTVNALGLDGSIYHMWTVIQQNGQTLTTGYTPLTFSGTSGQSYSVGVSNYNQLTFDHWENSAKTNPRTVTLSSGSLSVSAYYNSGTSNPPPAQTVGSITDSLSSNSVTVGQSISVSGEVLDTTSAPMPNVNLAITMGSYSTTATSGSTGTYSASIPASTAGTFKVSVATSDGKVSAPQLSLTVNAVTPPPSGKTGVYIPMYSISTLNSFLSIMQSSGPTLPYIVSVNPNSGPGSSVDSTFTNAINTLHNSGLNVTVIGYVPTGYGTSRSVANVEGMIDTWYSLYPHIDGIMFDEVDNTASTDSFYKTITDYARAHGAHFLRGNPGTSIDSGKVAMFDMIDVGEDSSYPSSSTLQSVTFDSAYGKEKFGYIVHSQSNLDTSWMTSAKQYLGCVYITNDVEPNPYDTVPSYFGTELAALEAQ